MSEESSQVFPMIEPPMRPARFYLLLFLSGCCIPLLMFAYLLLELPSFPAGADLSDLYWGSSLCIGFFVLLDLLVLYYYLSFRIYYASSVVMDRDGIQRVKNGIVKESYRWEELAAFYVNSKHTPANADWIILTSKPLAKPSRSMFRLRGCLNVKSKSGRVMQFSFSPQKEELLERYIQKRSLSF